MEVKAKVLLKGLTFGEGPRWHDNKLWFSDFYTNRVMTVDTNGVSKIVVELKDIPSGLGWLPDGRLLIVSMMERKLLQFDSNGLKVVADLNRYATGPCNDMVVNKKGCAYIGHFGFDMNRGAPFAPSSIIVVTPGGHVSEVANNMYFPNGCVITPDDSTLIIAESFASRLTAFDIDQNGKLSGRHVWAQLGECPPNEFLSKGIAMKWFSNNIVPDGICLDAENGIWAADASHNEVIRVVKGGEITHRVKVTTKAYACMLGGEDLCTLFIMTADTSQPEQAKAQKNGKVEIVRVDVPKAGLP